MHARTAAEVEEKQSNLMANFAPFEPRMHASLLLPLAQADACEASTNDQPSRSADDK
jgi:hypothetical protein